MSDDSATGNFPVQHGRQTVARSHEQRLKRQAGLATEAEGMGCTGSLEFSGTQIQSALMPAAARWRRRHTEAAD